MSSSGIPDALKWALEWARDFERHSDPAERQQLAERLLRCHEFLNRMEATAPRHERDGALLISTPLDSFSSTRARMRMSETTDSRGLPIPVTEDWQEQPPVRAFWHPRVFPDGMSAEDRALYPKRPLHVAQIPPFHPANVRYWELAREYEASRAPVGASKKSELTNEDLLDLSIALKEKRQPHTLQPSQWKSVADRLASNVKTQVGVMWAAQAALNLVNVPTPLPLVDATIARLTEITLRDVHEQTDLPINPRFIDDKLIAGTALILYHSVYTVALDATGEPIDFGGAHVPGGYAILVQERDSDMERRVPPPLTVYFSAERTRGSSFRITKGKVTRDFGTGIGTFLEGVAGTFETHPIQRGLISFLASTPMGWAAGVSAAAAFKGHSTSLADKALALPEFVGNAIPYAVIDVNRRIDRLKLRTLANQVGKQLLEEIIENSIKSAVQWMVLKQLGKSFVPAVKVAIKAYDTLSSAGDHDRTRTLLACVTMYLNGNAEDKVIALKVGGQILGEAAQEAVISQLTSRVSGRFGPQTAAPHVTDTTPRDATSKGKTTPTPDKAPFELGDVRTKSELDGSTARDGRKRALDSAPATEQPDSSGGKMEFVDRSGRPENQSVKPGTDSVRPRPKIWDTPSVSPQVADLVALEAAKKRAEDAARGNQPEVRATGPDGRQTGPQHQGTQNRGDQNRGDETPTEVQTAAPPKPGASKKPADEAPVRPYTPAEKHTHEQTGLPLPKVRRMKEVLGRLFNSLEVWGFGHVWSRVSARYQKAIQEVRALHDAGRTAEARAKAKDLYNRARNAFWREIRNPRIIPAHVAEQVRDTLRQAGFFFPRYTLAPKLKVKGRSKPVYLTIDHLKEQATHPELAISGDNLRFSLFYENVVVFSRTKSHDPHQSDARLSTSSGKLTPAGSHHKVDATKEPGTHDDANAAMEAFVSAFQPDPLEWDPFPSDAILSTEDSPVTPAGKFHAVDSTKEPGTDADVKAALDAAIRELGGDDDPKEER
jgi:hypothetical protein